MADIDSKLVKTSNEKKADAKKAADKKAADKNAKKPAQKNGGFFKSVSVELKKVHWPEKEKVVKYTGVVFGVVVVLGGIVWLFDTGFSAMLGLIIG